MKFEQSMIALAAAASVAGSASAAIPTVNISVQSSGGGSASSSPAGSAVSGSPNQYAYNSNLFSAGRFSTQFALYAMDTSATARQVIGGMISVINTSSSVQTFTIDISASTIAGGASSVVGGSMSGALADNFGDGAMFEIGGTVGGWAGSIRNGASSTQVGSLFSAPLQAIANPFQTAQISGQSFGLPGPSQAAIAMGDAATIRLTFRLGSNDKVDLSTAFVVQQVPAPGALALLAVAGLQGRRRRG